EMLCIPATTRASLAMYNTREDVDRLVEALKKLRRGSNERKKSATPQAATIEWPAASAPSPDAAADELAEVFELLDDRDAKNDYVLELGSKLPHAFELLKKIETRIPGCMSEVYLRARPSAEKVESMEFLADANAEIVR